jgi:orotate phosphoribosyltransferase
MTLDTASEPRERLLAELRRHALLKGSFVLTSGRTAEYLVDAKRAILLPEGFRALAGGADVKAFFVRKEVKQHGLSRRIEGPLLDSGERCMLVEDVVTTGGSTIRALQALRDEGHEVCGVLVICDRLAGGAQAIEEAAGAPFLALTTIDEVYPERPDR